MNVKHLFTLHGRCPVNGGLDFYTITVETDRVIETAAMVATAKRILSQPIMQEEFTTRFAAEINAKVTTAGRHGEVYTTASA